MAEEQRQSIIEHLEEFRSRLIISLIAILVTTSIAYIASDTILHYLLIPAGGVKLTAFGPMDGFIIKFRIALYGGIALAAPVWIFELLQYLAPGMTKEEKRYIVPGVVAMVVLFFLGNLFGYFMLSNMFSVMSSMFGSELTYLPSADPYISFVVYFLIAVGLSFEMPIVILVLMKLGIVTPEFLRKQRKISYFILFVFAELITPVADPFIAPMVVMAPMVVLFELALLMARFVVPKKPTPKPQPKPAPVKPIVPPAPPPVPPALPAVPAMAATEPITPSQVEPSPVGDTPSPVASESAFAVTSQVQQANPTTEPSMDENAKKSSDDNDKIEPAIS